MLDILGAIQRAALQGGILLLVGAAAWRLLVARPVFQLPSPGVAPADPRRIEALLRRRVARVAGAVAYGLIAIWVLRFVLQVAAFRDPFVPLTEDITLLLRYTIFGPVWIAQGVALFAVAIALALLGRGSGQGDAVAGNSPEAPALGRGAWGVVIVGAVILAFTLAMSSHALSEETTRELAVAADFVHALAAGAWMGSLVLILSTRKVETSGGDSLFGAQLKAFSPVAVVCVTLLVVMGTYLGWRYLAALSDLWTTPYGRVLSAKVVVAGAVLLMGFVNWRRDMPSIDSPGTRASIARRASWEVGVAVVVLVLTGVLTGTAR